MLTLHDRERRAEVLLANLRRDHERLSKQLEHANETQVYEDRIYRFYHGSFKVYNLQASTQEICNVLAAIAPEGSPFCPEFQQLLDLGAGKVFTPAVNSDWVNQTAPIVHAFLHARYFLEMAVKYGLAFDRLPQVLPSGFAALFCLFGIR